MRYAILVCGLLTACAQPYEDGFDDGCLQGALDGAMWGGVDAALCLSSNPAPGDPGTGSSRYDHGYFDGYVGCFPTHYEDAFYAATAFLNEDLGPCEEAPE